MAVKRAEFEIVASVKTNPEDLAALKTQLAELENMKAAAERMGLSTKGVDDEINKLTKSITAMQSAGLQNHMRDVARETHEAHENVHVLSRNLGELGHLIHYVFSPEALGIEGAFLLFDQLKESAEKAAESVRAFEELEKNLSTDRIDALAKAWNDAKIAAKDYRDEIDQHGRPEDKRTPQQHLHDLLKSWEADPNATPAEQLEQIKASADKLVKSFKSKEVDNSKLDSDSVDAAQKAIDDYKNKNSPEGLGINEEQMGSGDWERYQKNYASGLSPLQKSLDNARENQANDAAALKYQQGQTAEVRRKGDEAADNLQKYRDQIANNKRQQAEDDANRIRSGADAEIDDGMKHPGHDPEGKGLAAGLKYGSEYTSQAQFDAARQGIAKFAGDAYGRRNTDQLGQLIGEIMGLLREHSSKFGNVDLYLLQQAQEIRNLRDRLKNSNAASSLR